MTRECLLLDADHLPAVCSLYDAVSSVYCDSVQCATYIIQCPVFSAVIPLHCVQCAMQSAECSVT